MKSILIVTTVLMFTYSLKSQTFVSAGNVSGSWTVSGSPYIVQGDIVLPNLSSLTIDPGVQVLFDGYYYFEVYGKLTAVGTATDSIYFDVTDSTGYSDTTNLGKWKGMAILGNSLGGNACTYSYCVIQHTKATNFFQFPSSSMVVSSTMHAGAVCVYFSDSLTSISNCRISNNKGLACPDDFSIPTSPPVAGAINSSFSDLFISNCKIYNNTSLSGIALFTNSNGIIEDNEIFQNDACLYGGGILLFQNCSPFIYNNHIHNNYSGYVGGGICTYENSKSKLISNRIEKNTSENAGAGAYIYFSEEMEIISNLIANNNIISSSCGFSDGGAGIRISSTKNILFQNNIIVNNSNIYGLGGGAVLIYSKVNFYNNTIANNEAYSGGGMTMFCDSGSVILNTIIWNNVDCFASGLGAQVSAWGDTNAIVTHFENCIIENQLSDFYNSFGNPLTDTVFIFNDNPLFISPSAGAGIFFDGNIANWHTSSTSPIVDKGISDTTGFNFYTQDYDNNNRVFNIIDIGPYEWYDNTSVHEQNELTNYELYPNPTEGNTIISFNLTENKETAITVYDVLGKEIANVYNGNLNAGEHQYSIADKTKLSSGMYFIKLTVGDESFTKKLIVK